MKLPLLDYTKSLFKKTNLNEVLLIASQHILEAQRIMFEYLFELGLKPSNVFLIGKCYSTNVEVLNRFERMGMHISEKSKSFDAKKSFDEQFEEYTNELLHEVKKRVDMKNFKQIIMLEDGGNLIPQIKKVFKQTEKFTGVEQTSAGYEKLKEIKINFPVINVARSKAKLEIESQIIAATCLQRLEKQLIKINRNPKKVLIVGVGAIGKSLYEKMKEKYNVEKYDLNPILSNYKGVGLNSILKNFDMIIGSTGKEIMNQESYKSLKQDVILASVSSSDREFSAVDFRKMVRNVKDCHQNLKVNQICLLNGGFPINFDGAENSAEPEDIQITLALLFSAICLVAENKYPKGLIELDKQVQTKIIKRFQEIRK